MPDVHRSLVILTNKHQQLVSIKIRESNCNDTTLRHILGLPNIQTIHMEDCEITGFDIPEKVHLLDELSLKGSRLTDPGFFNICLNINTDRLSLLDLSATYVTLANMEDFEGTFSGLRVLRLLDCPQLTNVGIVSLLNKVGLALEVLYIKHISLTLDNVDTLQSYFPALRDLTVNCREMAESGRVGLCNRIGDDLQKLSLSFFSFTDTGFFNICRNINTDRLSILDLCFTLVVFVNVSDFKFTFSGLEVLSLEEESDHSVAVGHAEDERVDDENSPFPICLLNNIGPKMKELSIIFDFTDSFHTLNNINTLALDFSSLRVLKLDCIICDAALVRIFNKIGKQLEELRLKCPNVTLSNIEDTSCTFPNLKVLSVFSRALTNIGLVGLLRRCGQQLTELRLECSIITLSNVEDLTSTFPKLKLVKIFCRAFTEKGLVGLCNRVGDQLEELCLSCLDATFSNFQNMTCTFPKLKELTLGCRSLTDLALAGLYNRIGQQLESLQLTCHDYSLSGSLDFACTFPRLKVLNVFIRQLSDLGVVGLCNRIGEQLEELRLDCPDATFSNFEDMTCTFPKLKELSLVCQTLTDLALVGLCNRIGQQLERLKLHCPKSALRNIEGITVTFPKLRELNFFISGEPADHVLIRLCNQVGEDLEKLSMNNCSLALENIEQLTVTFSKLKTLNISNSATSTSNIIAFIKNVCQNLERLQMFNSKMDTRTLQAEFPSLIIR